MMKYWPRWRKFGKFYFNNLAVWLHVSRCCLQSKRCVKKFSRLSKKTTVGKTILVFKNDFAIICQLKDNFCSIQPFIFCFCDRLLIWRNESLDKKHFLPLHLCGFGTFRPFVFGRNHRRRTEETDSSRTLRRRLIQCVSFPGFESHAVNRFSFGARSFCQPLSSKHGRDWKIF